MAMIAKVSIFKTADSVTEYSPFLTGTMTASIPHLEAAISERYIYTSRYINQASSLPTIQNRTSLLYNGR
jgi:hypothetical protein